MAAFDPVTAFVAFVSFIAGYVSCRLLKKEDSPQQFGHHHSGHSKPYMRLRDNESADGAGAQTGDIVAKRKSKFDSLFNEYSSGKRETSQYGSQAAPDEQESRVVRSRESRSSAPAHRKNPHYIEIAPDVHDSPQTASTTQVKPKNKEQKEEWTPMGFFED